MGQNSTRLPDPLNPTAKGPHRRIRHRSHHKTKVSTELDSLQPQQESDDIQPRRVRRHGRRRVPLGDASGNSHQAVDAPWAHGETGGDEADRRRRSPSPLPKTNRRHRAPRQHRDHKAKSHRSDKLKKQKQSRSNVSFNETEPKGGNASNPRRLAESKKSKHARVKVKDLGQTKDCMVCTESRPLRRFPDRPPTAQCTHEVNTCKHCLRHWIDSEFRTKVWDQIGCPECGLRMQYEDMRISAPSEVFRRYDRLSTKAAFESIPGFRWCIAKGCKSGQVHEGVAEPQFICMGCGKSHCVRHNVPWHRNETCAQYDYRTDDRIKKAEEDASNKLIQETAKQCPGCTWNIEKHNGCDHMTCSKCRHEFCWLCLAPYEPIRRQGNRMHRADCAHRG